MTGIADLDPLLLAILVTSGCATLILAAFHPSVGVLAIAVCYLWPISVWFGQSAIPDTRPLAAAIALFMLFRSTPNRHTLASREIMWSLLLFGALCGLSAFWSQDQARTIAAFGAWPVLLVVLLALKRANAPSLGLLGRCAGTVFIASLLSGLAGLPFAYEGGRLRGILENANGIGVLAALAAPYFASKQTRLGWAMWLVVLCACVLSGSRAGLLGVAVGTAVVLWQRWSPLMRYIVFPCLAAAAYLAIDSILAFVAGGAFVVTRTNNSRAEVWELALEAHAESPWVGVGVGALETLSGSSALKVLAELGYIGAAAAAVLVLHMLVLSRRSALALGLVFAGVTNAVFEGWLFAAGSPFALLFFAMVILSVDESGVSARSAVSASKPASRGRPPQRDLRGGTSSR